MPPSAFDISYAIDLGDDSNSITLIGPPVETSGGLVVGEMLLVPMKDGGEATCLCVEFPLLNLGPERIGWVGVTVTGVSVDEVQVGHRASRGT